jgi:[amino group carrier protein]-lysine/ornithine hydrolase
MSHEPVTLLNLVKIYSPSGNETAAVEYLVARMQELHFTQAFRDEAGNAVGVMGSGPRQIVLLGHIDTVSGEIPVRVEPLLLTIPPLRSGLPYGDDALRDPQKGEGMVLYGRGSVDAKGPLCAFVDAVAACGSRPGWQIVVIGAVGEEGDSPGARHIVPLYHPDFAIIGEPSRWDRVTLGYKGSAWATIRVQRPRSHTAGQGESTCEAVVGAWETIRAKASAYNLERARIFDRLQLSLRGMDSGGDGFEEWAELRVSARLPLDLSPVRWYELLTNDPMISTIPGISIQPAGFPIPAYQCEKNTLLVRAFLAGIRAAGGQPGFVYKTGTADLNIVAPAWGCPALAYGPGDSALDHTPNEHLSLEEYEKAVSGIQVVLDKLCQGS